ncbi:ABC transporter ATP-binding protein, partial ['Camptotheca acuminata' phytoplasma]|uniref:ABC transporter ATP-binding protein n=1 Tax='Camptotheca acuminata' phytoplasma TaxID=3239192 RepID=UPI00351A519B
FMFNIINLNKSYTSKLGYRTDILKDISFQLPNTGIVFILGKSGSGKTTLLNLLGGMDDFERGDIQIYNNSFLNFKNNDYDNYRNSMVGFVFQDFNLISDLTVGQNIALSLELQGTRTNPSLINEILTSVDLECFETRKINELSGSQQQRVAIARAFIKKTDVVFCDEPTGNLDSETTEVIFNFLKKMSQEKLIVVITHDKKNAFKFGDRVIEVKDGQIVADLSRNAELQATNKTNNKLKYDLKGQVLTEEMLKSISQKMESDSNSYQKFFIPTSGTPEKIETIPLNNVKSHLSSLLALKMGTSLFKEKKYFY